MWCVSRSLILLDNSIWTINLTFNTKRNKNWQEDCGQVAVPVNAAFLAISLKGAVFLCHAELRFSTWLIAKPKSSYTGVKLLSLAELWFNCFIDRFKLTLWSLLFRCSLRPPYMAGSLPIVWEGTPKHKLCSFRKARSNCLLVHLLFG